MRFVLLYHTYDNFLENNHYDFMLEKKDFLDTWKIREDDLKKFFSGKEIFAEKNFDHRKKYLTYEGDISNNRGTVRRICSGEYNLLSNGENFFKINFVSEKIKGFISINKTGDIQKELYLFKYRENNGKQ